MSVDPITLKVINSYLESTAEEIGRRFRRSARSPVIREVGDCSAAIFTGDIQLIAQAAHVPAQLNSILPALEQTLHVFPLSSLSPGDVLATNDPYSGAQHLPDLIVFLPVFIEGEVVAVVSALGHHIDVGGMAASSLAPASVEIFQEGMRFPPLKVVEQGVRNETFFTILRANSRKPHALSNDVLAQIAACQYGIGQLEALFQRYGVETVRHTMAEIIAATAKAMQHEIAKIPDGVYDFEDVVDDDGGRATDIKIKATLTVQGAHLTVDFTGTDAQVDGPVNCPFGMTYSATSYIVKLVTDPLLPMNAGVMQPVTLIAPEGSLVNARFPAAVQTRMQSCHRICDVLLGALSQAIPERVMAACYGSTTTIAITGRDGQDKIYIHNEMTAGGMGARPMMDGVDGVMCHGSNGRNMPIEVVEAMYPLRVVRYEMVPDSGGPGHYRGGCGLRRELLVTGDRARLTTNSDRHRHAPYGLFGGAKGQPHRFLICHDGQARVMGSKLTNIDLEHGDIFVTRTAGGGGYGQPFTRPESLVQQDVEEGYVTRQSALDDYGVVFDEDGKLDQHATARLRKGVTDVDHTLQG